MGITGRALLGLFGLLILACSPDLNGEHIEVTVTMQPIEASRMATATAIPVPVTNVEKNQAHLER
jgi:hypothetical protein